MEKKREVYLFADSDWKDLSLRSIKDGLTAEGLFYSNKELGRNYGAVKVKITIEQVGE